MATSAAKWRVEVKGVKATKRAFAALSDSDAPFLRPAYQEAGTVSGAAVVGAAPVGGISARVSVLGKGAKTWAKVKVGKHPALKSFQWGRKKYYRGFTGRAMKATGTPFMSSPGFQARPFVGSALDSKAGQVAAILGSAYEHEFARVVGQGD